jgi:hypothetical protein
MANVRKAERPIETICFSVFCTAFIGCLISSLAGDVSACIITGVIALLFGVTCDVMKGRRG